MILDLMKIAPMAALATAGVKGKDGIRNQYHKFLNAAEVAATQSEVNDLAKMVYLDHISDTRVDAATFSDYCRKNLLLKAGQVRDTSIDRWGQPYTLTYLDRKFQVRSAGPDGTLETSDDVISGYNLQ